LSSKYPKYKDWIDKANSIQFDRAEAYKVIRSEDEESGGEDFLKEELLIAAALAIAVAEKGNEIEPIIAKAVKENPTALLGDAFQKASKIMKSSFDTGDTASVVSDNINEAMDKGAYASSRVKGYLDNVTSRKRLLEGMIKSSKYYTNEYFNNHVIPALYKEVEKILSSPTPVQEGGFNEVMEVLSKRLKSVPYWRVVANAAASRAYHYGVLKAGQLQGVRGYRIVAVLDARTSAICRKMNGKEFWLSNAIDLMERAATATDEEIKTVHPWVKFADVENLSNKQLADAGVIMPPFHGNCRSTVAAIY